MLPVGKSDRITAMLAVTDFTDDNFLLMLTDDGLIKKTPMSRLLKLRATGLSVIKLDVRSYSPHPQNNKHQKSPAISGVSARRNCFAFSHAEALYCKYYSMNSLPIDTGGR